MVGARFFGLLVSACVFVSALGGGATAAGSWEGAPSWLSVSGEARVRYETLEGQFRAGGNGGDQLLALRELLRVEAEAGRVTLGFELQDSRTYLDDAGTPLSSSFVNPLDFLQAYVRADLSSVFGQEADLTLGRMTLDIGSRRIVERNSFRNTINAYTGAHLKAGVGQGGRIEAFAATPVLKEPSERAARAVNDLQFDREDGERWFWGVFYAQRSDCLNATIETYLYGLNEWDSEGRQTPDREYYIPGMRVFRGASAGAWDFELEAVGRFGSRRATSDPQDEEDLRVRAHMLHAQIGYTFDHVFSPRIILEYDLASGDDNPTDNQFGQYERLFGTRRGDLGHTSIHGPLTRANLSAPGVRFEFKSGDRRFDGRFLYKPAWLAVGRDVWTVARVRDPSGSSGRFIGHTLDARVRYWFSPDRLRGEIGGSLLLGGEFARTAPGASPEDSTLFGYAQLTAYL